MRDGKLVVLQVLGGLNLGGAESRIMDITRNLSNTKVSYDFLLHSEGNDDYEEEARALGCHIYRVPRFYFFNLFAYKRAMREFFSSHPEIDIVQGHITSSAAIYLPIAKKFGAKATIAHARSAGVDAGIKGKLTRMLRKNLHKKADYLWTCSKEAALSVFGIEGAKRAVFIPNAIDVDKFALNSENAEGFNLKDKFVVGHIGRFHYAKNHEFLLEVFSEIVKIKDNAVLILVGDGETRPMIEAKIKELNIANRVILAGMHRDVEHYYKLFDIVLFPSRYEGLPGTIVESQAAGIPALCSDAVTKDMAVTDYVKYLGLDKSPKEWAKEAIKLADNRDKLDTNPSTKLKEAGFDIKSQCQMLEKKYKEVISK